jgi:hypothetical protein
MRKLREAALVATMVGGVTMVGAGAASAHGNGEAPTTVIIHCTQEVGDNTETSADGASGGNLVNISGPLLIGGPADSSSNQQVCGLNNEDIESTGGQSEAGEGGDLGSIL